MKILLNKKERSISSTATVDGQDVKLTLQKNKNLIYLIPQKSLLWWHGHQLLTKSVPAIKFEAMFANITLLYTGTLNFSRKSVFCYLCVPFFNPGEWAQTFVAFAEIFTRFIPFSLHFAAPVVVNIALPAVPATSASCPTSRHHFYFK